MLRRAFLAVLHGVVIGTVPHLAFAVRRVFLFLLQRLLYRGKLSLGLLHLLVEVVLLRLVVGIGGVDLDIKLYHVYGVLSFHRDNKNCLPVRFLESLYVLFISLGITLHKQFF